MSCAERNCFACAVKDISGFSRINEIQSDRLAKIKKEITIKQGESLPFKQNGQHGFCCLNEGFLKLSYFNDSQSKTVRICGRGELVGFNKWKSFSRGKIQATALGGPARLCFFPHQNFDELSRREPEILIGLLNMMASLVEQYELRISNLSNHYLRNRVAAALVFLDDKFGLPSENGSRIVVNIDRITLSELAGTVRESTARILSELESEKIISRNGRNIHVLDKSRLYQLTL